MTSAATIESLHGCTVLSVGDVMLDEYVSGDVDRISPEAPIPVVAVQRRTHVAGGAANAAAGVVALGGRALLGGIAGADLAADHLREATAEAGVDTDGVLTDRSRPTTTKTRVIARGQQVVRADLEDARPVGAELEQAILDWAERRLPEADSVLISDYAKGLITTTVAQGLIHLARSAGKPVVVDPKGLDYAKYRGATLVAPNAHDAGRSANVHVHGYDDLVEAAGRLREVCAGVALLVTRGADGMTLFAGGAPVDVATDARSVYDVTGAGDTVVAVLAAALGRGVGLEAAVRLANAAAGIVVAKAGTATVSLDELSARFAGDTGS
jgi:D-beta-D-heptose 7-phosphate kinase/D-beta-D-heptose 1-phosphate adenosyltransferase